MQIGTTFTVSWEVVARKNSPQGINPDNDMDRAYCDANTIYVLIDDNITDVHGTKWYGVLTPTVGVVFFIKTWFDTDRNYTCLT